MVAHTLLVPVDFDESSLEAVKFARWLAARLKVQLVLLHVFKPHTPLSLDGETPFTDDDYDAAASQERFTLSELAHASEKLRTLFRVGDPAREILRVIEESAPEMVVMGTHGRTGLRRLLLGSVAEEVVRKSSVPVITVPTTRSASSRDAA